VSKREVIGPVVETCARSRVRQQGKVECFCDRLY
jgi:hypothetical protein